MDMIKLTPYQTIFYYEWLQNPERSDYNIVIDNTLEGEIDKKRYSDSIGEVINEHFISRHTIDDGDEGPFWVARESVLNIAVFHDEPLTEQEIYDLVSAPFDLKKGPLARIHLIDLGDNRYRSIFIFHHIIVDGISTEEIWDKWRKRYNGIEYQVPSLAVQSEMHQNLHQKLTALMEEKGVQMREFWRERLSDLEGPDLRFLQPGRQPAATSARRQIRELLFSFDEQQSRSVASLLRKYKLTPYLFGQMIMGMLLHKMSGQKAVAIAYPVAITEGKELLYGAHINTLAIDYRFEDASTLRSVIDNIHHFYKSLKKASAKYLPVHEILACGEGTGLLDVAFVQTFLRDHRTHFSGIVNESTNHEFQIDLVNTLLFEQEAQANRISYRVKFDGRVLDASLVKNFIELYKNLFLTTLDILNAGDVDLAVDKINLIASQPLQSSPLYACTSSPVPQHSIVKQFEHVAAAWPERSAIICGDDVLTYQQLNERANRLAHYLKRELAISAGDFVALCLEKSAWMPVCILAVLKAGAAYIPLNPGEAEHRLGYILQDTGAKAILSDGESVARLNPIPDLPVVTVDNPVFQNDLVAFKQSGNPDTAIALNQLAYVIYTSGTTGKPKGVMIEHAGLINLALAQGEAFGLGQGEAAAKQCLWYAAYVFDAHVSELFTAIASGHALHILQEPVRKDYDALARYISDHKIDIATIPPALLDKNSPLPLATLVVAGEPCNREIMERYRSQGTTVINAYGPTESSVCATLHYFESGDSNLNIGLPLPNIDVHVLDKNLNPVPPGAIGELYISGVGLARGYLNDAHQTAQAFIASPFQSDEQKLHSEAARLYKTGDLVRRLPDSSIEYDGRRDSQVKIRGFRIELSEIEMQLAQVPEIIQAAVVAHKLPTGARALVAYYVSDAALDKQRIAEHLSRGLPDYMVPAAYIHLTAFPMTVNGKLNHKALPQPDWSREDSYVAPEGKTETELCRIFSEILGQAPGQVGVNDEFFRLGGDSISAIQTIRLVRQRLKGTIAVKDIVECKTVRLLAKRIAFDEDSRVEHLSESGMLTGQVPMLPIQQWFFDQADRGTFADYQHWNQSFILDVPRLDADVLRQSLALLFAYHDALRMTFVRDGQGSYRQRYQPEITEVPLSVVEAAENKEREAALFDRWQRGFDIFAGKLCHVGYIHNENAPRAKLHFAFHHLIVDAVSWHIIRQDLERLYLAVEASPAGISDPAEVLGDKPTSYRQWVAHVQGYASQQETVYWHNAMRGMEDYRRELAPIFTSPSLSQCEVSLGQPLTQSLLGRIHAVLNTQVNDILLASLAHTLNAFNGLNTQYLTLEGHGREPLDASVDVNRTVGWLTNMYPVRLACSGDWLRQIVAVKESLGEVPHRGVGFAPLVGYGREQLPPIGFNYLGRFDESLQEGWRFSSEDAGAAVSPENGEMHLLSVNAGIIGGQLKIRLSGYLAESAMQQLAERYLAAITDAIGHLLAQTRTYLTAKDIEGVISQQTLDRLQHNGELESVYLANSLQEGFIYHAVSQGEVDDAYHTQMFWDYDNALDINCLKQAWLQTQEHYPTLRLRFDWSEELIQIVDTQAALNWSFFDLSEKNEQQQSTFFADLCAQDRARPYDLSVGGLFRVYTIKNSQTHYRCIFSCHHAILDGWSNPLLIEAVHQRYLALLRNDEQEQGTDAAFHQVQRYMQAHRSEHLQYWRDYLARMDEPEDLTILLSGQAKHTNLNEYRHVKTAKTKPLVFDEQRYRQLKSFTAEHGVTVNAVLQYCWHKVLSIYPGSPHSIVGTVVSGRNLPLEGVDQTVGLLINTLPLIVDHQKEASILAAIQRLQDDINEANTRSNVNLAQLQPSGKRLFNSLFVFENYPVPDTDLGDELRLRFGSTAEKQDYPLVITAFEQQSLTLSLHYAGELFDDATIDQLLKTMDTLVGNIIHDAHQPQNALNAVEKQQYQMIIHDWNATCKPYERDKTLAALFEERAANSPDSIALEYGDVVLTYSQLNQRANRLAHHLQERCQIRASDLVGLYLHRSEQIVISILAILKAGGAYVPMDPESPDERNGYIISDAKVKAVLCHQQDAQALSHMAPDVLLIPLDAQHTLEQLAGCSEDNPDSETCSSDLAYVIYTSGTTGYPKGTLIEQRCVNRLVINTNFVEIGEQDRILAISGYQFDASTYDIFGSLLNGAAVVLADKQNILDLERFDRLIAGRRITNFFATPAFFNTLVDAQLPSLRSLSYVLIGGEQASVSHVNRFRTLYPQVRLVNAYGPTETTTFAAAYLTNSASQPFDYTVPIGRPITNTQLYLLDKHLRPVPLGAIGELYIGGPGVGRGYLNNPQATAAAFIASPFSGDGENGRLYRTGDRARYLPDGSIEYLGRNDFQVKIRGFRIEPGEIEARLNDLPGVHQALVLANRGPAGDTRLVVYYVADAALAEESLREALRQTLPDYMIPSAFVHLAALPVTVNGKVDRAALPAPVLEAQADRVGPATATEQQVTGLFAEQLGIPEAHLSVLDDFYRLGGNSILAIKLAGRLTRQLGKNVHVADLFRLKSIRAVAAFIDGGTQASTVMRAPRISRPEEQRLSFAQERLWFIDSYEEGSNAYNIPLTFRLHAHQHRVFDLARECPVAAHRFTLAGTGYVSLVIHHIAFDGWSVDLLLRELLHYYRVSAGEASGELPLPAVQYREFALWQREHLQGATLERQLAYWCAELADHQPLNLPTDHVRPLQMDYRGEDIRFRLDEQTSAELRALAATLNVSLYTVLLSGYCLMLGVYSSQQDIVLGTPIAGRHYPGVEETMGLFVNTLVLRRRIDAEQTVGAFIGETGQKVNEAHAHQDLPFEKLVEALKAEKDGSRHPIFQVMFSLQSFGAAGRCDGESCFEQYDAQEGAYRMAKFDLTVMMDDSEAAIGGVFNYATSLFSAGTVEGYIATYRHILSQLGTLCAREQALSAVQYLDDAGYRRLIDGGNATECDYPREMTIHGMFEAQVARTPEHTALVYEEVSLSYRELNERANRLAAYLREEHGVRTGDLVALSMERSEQMMISILAILKAGGAYVPLDPQAPDDRVSYMLDNASIGIVLTTGSGAEKAPALSASGRSPIDVADPKTSAVIARYPGENLPSSVRSTDLAYIIYTSGTTGNPKGVMLEHHSVINRIVWMHKQYPIGHHDRILQKTNYTFDVSVWELFWANWYGACTVFASQAAYKDNDYLAELIERQKVTTLHFVPSMLSAFLETLEGQSALQARLGSLNYLFCSGEALNVGEVRKCQRLIPHCQIHNLYGPTEATVDVLFYDCNDRDIDDVLIGRPIDNTAAYVLNAQMQPVPPGAIGELYIGGVGVARGYLNNQPLTDKVFLSNPFQTGDEKQRDYNGRIYKTGDVVRYLSSGDIQYLGRNDFQVKVRGYRIELGEIETRLASYPHINHAVVIACERGATDKYLVAYYVSEREIEAENLIHHLRETLPEYMVPGVFVHLTELPITSNGKLNRKALPEPMITHSVAYVAPVDKVEKTLCKLLASILQVPCEGISMEDNFFALGGNSILAMRLNNRINQTLRVKIRLLDIINARTLKALAQEITQAQGKSFDAIVPFNGVSEKQQMFMIHPGMGNCSVYQSLANRLSESYCCYGVDSYNFYHDRKIEQIDELARYYLAQIDRILDVSRPVILLGWSLGGKIALEIAAHLEARGITSINIYLLDTWLLSDENDHLNEASLNLDAMMDRLNIPHYLRGNVESVVASERLLNVQPLSAVLTHSRITLFKAMDEILRDKFQQYRFNNVDSCIKDIAQLQLVEIAASHLTLLEKEDELINLIH